MKFFPLIETAANSGQFQLSGTAVEAESTTAALALIAPTVGVGLRYGAWLYHEVRGLPDFFCGCRPLCKSFLTHIDV
ncbi:MAG: hypothetical protein GX486_07535 [Acetobacter sp.]|nr:hypothetical protein [Acetobacter sp.]